MSDAESLVVSELTRLECRIKPIRNNDSALLEDYDRFFSEAASEIVPLSREVIDLATMIRSRSGVKTPDSIHVEAAVVSGCDVFLTNDHRLDRINDILLSKFYN